MTADPRKPDSATIAATLRDYFDRGTVDIWNNLLWAADALEQPVAQGVSESLPRSEVDRLANALLLEMFGNDQALIDGWKAKFDTKWIVAVGFITKEVRPCPPTGSEWRSMPIDPDHKTLEHMAREMGYTLEETLGTYKLFIETPHVSANSQEATERKP